MMRIWYLVCLILYVPVVMAVGEPSREELERWLESDDDMPPSMAVSEVNEGELVFLREPPARVVHHHMNRIVIDADSLQQGWVLLLQCHENLDQVSRVQITYSHERVRDLQVTRQRNIGSSWVEDSTVQMTDVGANAQLCVQAQVRALVANADGSYSLYNGPFMRRFLDGYYPMRVSMDVDYSATALQLVDMTPDEQQGFQVSNSNGHLYFDAWFEGRLRTEFLFWLD